MMPLRRRKQQKQHGMAMAWLQPPVLQSWGWAGGRAGGLQVPWAVLSAVPLLQVLLLQLNDSGLLRSALSDACEWE